MSMRATLSTFLIASAALFAGCGDSSSNEPTTQTADSGADTGSVVADTAVADTAAPAVCSEPAAGTVANVSVAALKALIDSGAKLTVVDVREPSETAAGVIAGALLYPWNSGVLEAKHAELPTDRPIYVICRSGNRSVPASAFLAKNGHACIHNTEGGMLAWAAASYPTVKP